MRSFGRRFVLLCAPRITDGRLGTGVGRQLHSTFDAELRERVAALEQHLVLLEEADGATAAAQAFDTLYRVAYNLQGAAHVVELADVAHLGRHTRMAFQRRACPEVPLGGPGSPRSGARSPSCRCWWKQVGRVLQPPDLFDVLADLVAPSVAAEPAPEVFAAPPQVAVAPIAAAPVTALPLTASGPAESVRVKVGKLDALLARGLVNWRWHGSGSVSD